MPSGCSAPSRTRAPREKNVAPPDSAGRPPTLREAYAYCERLAKTHYENFTVGSILLPAAYRPAFHAVYAFCRHTDDLGDEAPGDRLALLDEWSDAFAAACNGAQPLHPILIALQNAIQHFSIPPNLFQKLIQANRIDQGDGRFPTYNDLLHYCDHSANPVGRIILSIVGIRDEERSRLSDSVCTALQLANFWQDIKRDYQKGRIYIPLEDMQRFGYTEPDLAASLVNDNFRRLMAFEVERAQQLFEHGLELINHIDGRLKFDIALFSRGGLSVLDSIRKQNYDVLAKRPVVSSPRKLRIMASTAVRLAMRKPAA